MKMIAYEMLKLALRACRRAGYHNLKGLALDAIGDVGGYVGFRR